jgi:hypothetical protein
MEGKDPVYALFDEEEDDEDIPYEEIDLPNHRAELNRLDTIQRHLNLLILNMLQIELLLLYIRSLSTIQRQRSSSQSTRTIMSYLVARMLLSLEKKRLDHSSMTSREDLYLCGKSLLNESFLSILFN